MTRVPSPHCPASSAQAGFTLVEMMVALAIFAILAAAGVGMLRASVDTQAAVDQRLVAIGRLGRLEALLTSDLAQAVDRPTRAPAGERPAFEGDSRSLRLVRGGYANLEQEPRPDLQRVEWRIAGRAILRTGFSRLDGGEEAAPAAQLAKDLDKAAFRYRTQDGRWSEAFRSTDEQRLPAAVELNLLGNRDAPVIMVFALPQAPRPGPAS